LGSEIGVIRIELDHVPLLLAGDLGDGLLVVSIALQMEREQTFGGISLDINLVLTQHGLGLVSYKADCFGGWARWNRRKRGGWVSGGGLLLFVGSFEGFLLGRQRRGLFGLLVAERGAGRGRDH